jgi:hypothetical protein
VNVWRAVARELRRYDSAVVAARDADGYPVSVRCVPVADASGGTFSLPLPDGLGCLAGPAWLLCHSHDDRFWSLRSFGARGSLERTPDGWRFRPIALVPGLGGFVPMIRLFVGGRRRARRYLNSRGLVPPAVPWDRIIAIKHEMVARRDFRNDSRTPGR